MNADIAERYRRNILLPEFGEKGQRVLFDSSVLVIGLGGLGSPAAMYLAAAGIGTLGIADYDTVELSNLQRQILHAEKMVGRSKCDSAERRIGEFNSSVAVKKFTGRLSGSQLHETVKSFDFVIEATDNFAAKFLINDTCLSAAVPFSHGGVSEYFGQTLTVVPGKGCCYRCVFSDIPREEDVPPASQLGVFGPAAGVLGSIQAAEAVKYLTGSGLLLTNRLLTFDSREMSFREIALSQRRDCPACGMQR